MSGWFAVSVSGCSPHADGYLRIFPAGDARSEETEGGETRSSLTFLHVWGKTRNDGWLC